MRYPVFFEKSPTGYSAYIPDLPGCIATGGTLDEVRKLISEAMEMHIAGMIEDSDEIPDAPAHVEWVEVSRELKAES
jgi:predicted RNase H-like HicB family nuclease